MSHIRKGILGVAAIVATFGAAQFASGEDLTAGLRTAGTPEQGVNRLAKADRAPVFSEAMAPTRTISIQLERVPDTSVLVRIPAPHEAAGATPPASSVKASEQRRMVACEPVVSVLTEIARKLQPGRCVT